MKIYFDTFEVLNYQCFVPLKFFEAKYSINNRDFLTTYEWIIVSVHYFWTSWTQKGICNGNENFMQNMWAASCSLIFLYSLNSTVMAMNTIMNFVNYYNIWTLVRFFTFIRVWNHSVWDLLIIDRYMATARFRIPECIQHFIILIYSFGRIFQCEWDERIIQKCECSV